MGKSSFLKLNAVRVAFNLAEVLFIDYQVQKVLKV